MSAPRRAVLQALADVVLARVRRHPADVLRVAVTGVTASGKSTLAAELPGSIVILDASFLLRPEVRDHFDYRILVQTSFEIAEARGVRRDAAALGGEDEATRLYRTRYHEAQRIYFREARPLEHADAIVVNDDVERPVLFTRGVPGLASDGA